MTKVVVRYEHDSADLSPIYLAVTATDKPPTNGWKPALRDVAGGRRVVWARFSGQGGQMVTVWIRDHSGDRAVTKMRL